jgi:hypothetical protein
MYYIENIVVILLCCNPIITVVYCHIQIYKKGWLTNMLGILIILNSLQPYTPVYYDQTKLMVQGGNPTRHERIKKKKRKPYRKKVD